MTTGANDTSLFEASFIEERRKERRQELIEADAQVMIELAERRKRQEEALAAKAAAKSAAAAAAVAQAEVAAAKAAETPPRVDCRSKPTSPVTPKSEVGAAAAVVRLVFSMLCALAAPPGPVPAFAGHRSDLTCTRARAHMLLQGIPISAPPALLSRESLGTLGSEVMTTVTAIPPAAPRHNALCR